MIISHEHRYLYIELPRTGSTAVSKELRTNYGGVKILKNHSTYRDFLRQASPTEQKYFAFSSIRNPVDKVLSLYFKYKIDHRGYDKSDTYKRSNPFVSRLMRSQFRFVKEFDPSFAEFFKKYYFVPYNDWSSLDHRKLDYVMRFERLGADFEHAIKLMGLELVRPLPTANKTANKKSDFWTYIDPSIQRRVQWVFGPYFRRWGYEFPETWDLAKLPGNDLAFSLANLVRHFYWRYLR